MASPPTRKITAEKLAEAEREEQYWRRKSVAAGLRSEAVALDPGLGEPSAARQSRSANLAEQYESHYAEGLKISAFQKGLGTHDGQKPQPKLSPKEVLDRKAGIIEALARVGRSPSEIEEYLNRLGPFLDTASLASDPLAASILYNRVMTSGTQGLGMKDVIETIKVVSDMRSGPQSAQTDVAQVIQALGTFMSAIAKQNQGDPAATFALGMQSIQPLYAQMNESTRLALQSQIDLLKTQNRDPVSYLSELRETAEVLGWGPREPEPVEITKYKLQSNDAREQRMLDMRREDMKEKRQSEMLKGIVDTIKRAVESPVVREFGRSVGKSIGADRSSVVQAAVTAPAAAATTALANATDVPWGFTCPKCKVPRTFTQKELALLEEKGGNWVCPSPGCGEAYKLQPRSGKKTPDDGASTF